MRKLYGILGVVLSAVGVVLLACGLLLTPTGGVLLADDPIGIAKCPGEDNCKMGCSVNGQANGCNGGCSTAPPDCTYCECVVTKTDPSCFVIQCGCR